MNVPIVAGQAGGDLMTTKVSRDVAGANNFVLKRDWRRELDREVRREGDLPFAPASGGTGNQPFPNHPSTAEAITLEFTGRQDNGHTTFICGTPSTLFRFFRFEDQAIVAAGIVQAGILGTISDGIWLIIGTGFSGGHRWEAVNCGGLTIFNNGADLPLRYHLSEFSVTPLYELREQGIAFVETIEELNGMLLLGGVAQLVDSASFFATSGSPYGRVTDPTLYDIVHYLFMWSDPAGPGRWAAQMTGTIRYQSQVFHPAYNGLSMQSGDAVRLKGMGLNGGDLLTTLQSKFIDATTGLPAWILADAAVFQPDRYLADNADIMRFAQWTKGPGKDWATANNINTVEDAALYHWNTYGKYELWRSAPAAPLAEQDAASLICGSYPVLDDSTAILRIKKLGSAVIIAKGSGFVLASFTGAAGAPFSFLRVYSGDQALVWKWTLINLEDTSLVYAGADDFYTFDAATLKPSKHPKLTLCSDVFFSVVQPPSPAAQANQDSVFAVDNRITKEVWFLFPSAGPDYGLTWDYRAQDLGGNRCATLGAAYTAGAMIDNPAAPGTDWFVLGNAVGTVLQYGRDRGGALAFQRNGANYYSDMWSGLADFGDAVNMKHVRQYLLLLASQSPNTPLTVQFFATLNAAVAATELAGSPVTFNNPAAHNTIYPHWLVQLIQERIRATGSTDAQIAQRVWSIGRVGGASSGRL